MSKVVKVLLLIVDDEMSLAEMYADKFRQAGFSIDVAHDGQEGFEKMAAEHPTLVLMDILMPGMSGEQAVEKAKHDPSIQHIPIVMLTNYASSIELKNAMQQGAVDYIVKSETTPAQVVEKVQSILNARPVPKPNTNNKGHKYLSR
jgi:CheY-like chemotaxis protein